MRIVFVRNTTMEKKVKRVDDPSAFTAALEDRSSRAGAAYKQSMIAAGHHALKAQAALLAARNRGVWHPHFLEGGREYLHEEVRASQRALDEHTGSLARADSPVPVDGPSKTRYGTWEEKHPGEKFDADASGPPLGKSGLRLVKAAHDVSGEARDDKGEWTASGAPKAKKPAAENTAFRDGKYWYRGTVRPLRESTAPDGPGRVFDASRGEHGAVGYDRKLSAEDMKDYTIMPDHPELRTTPQITAKYGMDPYRQSSPSPENWRSMARMSTVAGDAKFREYWREYSAADKALRDIDAKRPRGNDDAYYAWARQRDPIAKKRNDLHQKMLTIYPGERIAAQRDADEAKRKKPLAKSGVLLRFFKSGGAARKRDVSGEARIPGGQSEGGEWTTGGGSGTAGFPGVVRPEGEPPAHAAKAPGARATPATPPGKAKAATDAPAAKATDAKAAVPDFHPTLGYPRATPEDMAKAKALGVNLGPMSYGVTFPQGKKYVMQYYDLRERRQSRYPPSQGQASRENKFRDRLVKFSKALPAIRQAAARDLALPGTSKERAAAAVVMIIDKTNMRIGGESFATRAGDPTYGASSLRKEHVRVEGDTVHFSFIGKEHQKWERSVADPELARCVHEFLQTPGDRLWNVTDTNVRDYLAPFGVNPHLWRTNTACKVVAEGLAKAGPPQNEADAKKKVKAAVTEAAEALGNKPAACLANYVDPTIIEAYLQGVVPK